MWRSLTVQDTPAWSELTALAAAADGTDTHYEAEDLAEELANPGLDPARDTVGAFAADGSLLAAAQVTAPRRRASGEVWGRFDATISPTARGTGVDDELLTRAHQRAIARAAESFPGEPFRITTEVGRDAKDLRVLLEGRGYTPVRYFHVMRHDLGELDPSRADGIVFTPELDEQVRVAHVDAFADHWGSAPPDPTGWAARYTGSRSFRPDCSSVRFGPDAHVDGYLLAYQFQPGELWFGQIGVRPRAQGRGIATGLLHRSLLAAREHGYSVVKLDVDTENVHGAGRLYEAVGFAAAGGTVIYQAP